MNRMEEYNNLLTKLDTPPPVLADTIKRAGTRVKRKRRLHRLLTISSSFAVFLITFIVLVNVSATFALACSRIPLLRELAAAVAFSPSLSAAVDNAYVQPIGLEQTVNGITMRVEHVIVDQKQLNIFYTLASEAYSRLDVAPSISASDGAKIEGYTIYSSRYGEAYAELRQITVDFASQAKNNMPDSLVLTCAVDAKVSNTVAGSAPAQADLTSAPAEHAEPAYISTFTFTLNFDPAFTQQGEVIELNQSFSLDGQRLTATTIEVYPTHIRLNLTADTGNTAWLKSLMCRLEDELGNQFEQVSNGIAATGEIDSPMMSSYRLESSYFATPGSLTLYITGALWLDKDKERIRVNLADGTADNLPEGVKLVEAARKGGSWHLTFTGPRRKESAMYQLFLTNYYDEAGNTYTNNSWMSGSYSYWDEKAQKVVENPDEFQEQFALADYPYDVVYLSPAFSRTAAIDSPIVIKVN